MIVPAYQGQNYVQSRHVDPSGRFAVARLDLPLIPQQPWGLQQRDRTLFSCGVITNCALEGNATSAFRQMIGHFSGLLCETHTIFLAADRKSSLPIFYCDHNGSLFFAPEVDCLIAAMDGAPMQTDLGGIGSFLASGAPMEGKTFWQGIKKLPGGHFLSVDSSGHLQEHTYYEFLPGSNPRRTNGVSLHEEFLDLVLQAVARNFEPNGHCVIPLSGGVDSRLIACAARKYYGPQAPISTVTFDYEHGGPSEDSVVAERVAHAIGAQHEIMLHDLTGFAECFEKFAKITNRMSLIPAEHAQNWFWYHSIRERGFQTYLRGDEVFGWKSKAFSFEEAYLESQIRKFSDVAVLRSLVHGDIYECMREECDSLFSNFADRYTDLPPNLTKDKIYYDFRLQNYLGAGNYLRRSILDDRNPLLDESILDFLHTVPDRLRIDKRLARSVSREKWLHPEIKNSIDHPMVPRRLVFQDDNEMGQTFALAVSDNESPVWSILNRTAWSQMFTTQGSIGAETRRGIRQTVQPPLQSLALQIAPKRTNALRSRRRSGRISAESLAHRFLVLKSWCEANLN